MNLSNTSKQSLISSFKIKQVKIPHRLILAPMCGITLKPFRIICKEFGAGLVFNQMVSAKALTMKDSKTVKMLLYDDAERPIGMQLFGNNADTLSEAAKIIEETNTDIIDLNLGCPAKKIVNDGGGSALLNDLNKLKNILHKMRKSIQTAFTVKIRAGWDEKCKNALEIANIAEGEGVDALTIHARTRAQGYSGKSDWELIKTIKNNLSIPVIGNGDIQNASDAIKMLKETGCDAVMTGRGAFNTPWIFKNFTEGTNTPLEINDLKNMILRQYQYFIEFFGPSNGIKMMRKFICAYSKGMHSGSCFRNEVVRIDDWNSVKQKINDFFNHDKSGVSSR